MENDRIMKRERNLLHIECMRILAAFFVIFNHTEGNGYFLFAGCPRGSLSYWLYMSISVFCKISVPLFFMIAGALLLRKEVSLPKIWREKIVRMVLALCIFSLVSYIGMGILVPDSKLSVADFNFEPEKSNLSSTGFVGLRSIENKRFSSFAVLSTVLMVVLCSSLAYMGFGEHSAFPFNPCNLSTISVRYKILDF